MSGILEKKKEKADCILSIPVYQSKEKAVETCFEIPNLDLLTQSCIIGQWLFYKWDGIMLLCDSVLKGCGDFGYFHIFEIKTSPIDDVFHIEEQEEKHFKYSWIYKNSSEYSKPDRYGSISLYEEKDRYHPWFVLLCHMFARIQVNKICVELRTSWHWVSNDLYMCPWSSFQNYALIPVKYMDIRCKEVIASMIHNSGWTSFEYMNHSKTVLSSGFRFNSIMEQYFEKKGKKRFCVAFPLIIIYTIQRFFGNNNEKKTSDKVVRKFIKDLLKYTVDLLETEYKQIKHRAVLNIENIQPLCDHIMELYKKIPQDGGFSGLKKVLSDHY